MHNTLLFIALFLLLSSQDLFSQVTIGSANEPISGALLQLKENESTGVNSTKGLALPCVALKAIDDLSPCLETTDEITDETKKLHSGLIVFNVTENLCKDKSLRKGIFVWEETKWTYLQIEKESSIFTDTRGDDIQEYKTTSYKLKDTNGEVVIDAGEWMQENLRASVFSPNLVVEKQPVLIYSDTEIDTIPQIRLYENSVFTEQGYLYNTYSAFNGYDMTRQDVNSPGYKAPSRIQQGICPEGWRIPTYEDWVALKNVISQDTLCYYSEYIESRPPFSGLFSKDNTEVTGTSNDFENGGFNLYTNVTKDGLTGAYYWMTFPAPYGSYTSPFATPIYVFPDTGIETLPQMGYNSFMPIRCVRGKAPDQIAYNSKWDYFLPNN